MAIRKRYNEPVKHEDLLTDEMKQAIREQAKKEVLEAQKKEAAKLLLEKFKEEELASLEPELSYTDITIDVPGYTKNILVDGRSLDQGQTYKVTKMQFDSLREIMANSWRHERSNGGAHMKEYMPPRESVVTPNGSYNKLARV